jgi:hypothetical protein
VAMREVSLRVDGLVVSGAHFGPARRVDLGQDRLVIWARTKGAGRSE